MRIHYKKAVSVFLIVMTMLSCQESFLEIKPYGSVSEFTLANEEGLDKILIGAYSCLDGGARGLTGGSWTSPLIMKMGDDNRHGTNAGVREYDAFLFTPSEGNIENKWKFLYSAVLRCNDVLKLLPRVEESTPGRLLQIEAEAKFLRGVFYLELAKWWKNVPWIDETVEYSEGNYLVPNTENIYPKIEADFAFAGEHLTETKGEVGRANKWAARAFLAKTYMFQHKFGEAKTLLEEIIANGQTSNGLKYALLEEYNHNFITRTKHGSEAVFAVQMSVNDGTDGYNGNPMDQWIGTFGGPAATCCGFVQPTFDLVDAHQTDPVSGLPLIDTYVNSPVPHDNGLASSNPFTPYTGTLDPRLDWSVGRRGIPYRDWGVHPGKAWIRNQFNGGPYSAIKNACEQAYVDTDRAGGSFTSNPLNLIRFADVLLWVAECEVEVGSLTKAEEYVNMIRARAANPAGWVKTYIDPSNPLKGFTNTPAANYKVGLYAGQFEANGKSYARKAVRMERRLELALEGHRFFDLVRYDGLDFDIATRMNWFMQREGNELLNPSNNYLAGEFVRNKHEYFPIPQRQIDLSVNKDGESVLLQNPGYN